jgi:hypothetical protein
MLAECAGGLLTGSKKFGVRNLSLNAPSASTRCPSALTLTAGRRSLRGKQAEPDHGIETRAPASAMVAHRECALRRPRETDKPKGRDRERRKRILPCWRRNLQAQIVRSVRDAQYSAAVSVGKDTYSLGRTQRSAVLARDMTPQSTSDAPMRPEQANARRPGFLHAHTRRSR